MVSTAKKINLWYVKGLRVIEGSPEPHPKLLSVVDYINDKYQSAGIPLEVGLKDIDSFLRGLNNSDLEKLAQKVGPRDKLIDLIQTPISQEECRRRNGIECRNGVWYLKDSNGFEKELKPYANGLQEDSDNFRFRKDFVAEKERKYQMQHSEIMGFAEGIHNHDEKLIRGLSSLTFSLRYGCDGVNSVLKLSELSVNDYIELKFKNEGGRERFKELSDKFYLGDPNISHLSFTDQFALSINFVSPRELRKKYFERFKHIMREEVFEYNPGKITRVNFSERPDSDYGDYDHFNGFLGLSKRENEFNHLLVDRITPYFLFSESLLYELVRSYYGKTSYSSVLLDLTIPKIAFLIMHELVHQTTGADDQFKLHPELDSNLMNAPIYYEEVSEEVLERKMSPISLRDAYKSL